MNAPHIRAVSDDDTPRLAHLYRQAYRSAADLGYPSRMTEIEADTVAEWLEREATTLVAVDPSTPPAVDPSDASLQRTVTGRFAGTVRLLEEREVPYLERLAVHPDYQDAGLGGQLVDRVETLARDRGADRLQLTTFDGHPFLLEWYRERGYDHIEYHESDEREYDFVTMERRLSG